MPMARRSSRWQSHIYPARGTTPATRITDLYPFDLISLSIMDSNNKTYLPTELGPWILGGLSFKEPGEEEEKKEQSIHVQRRTELRLPRLANQNRKSLEGKLQKHELKMSHQSLQLSKEALKETVITSRYETINRTFVPIRKNKERDKRLSEYNQIQLKVKEENNQVKTIDAATICRKVSTVQLGDVTLAHRPVRGGTKRLMNEQAAKKRGIIQFIRDVTRNSDFMEYYINKKRSGKISSKALE